jgi:hypothetical protein
MPPEASAAVRPAAAVRSPAPFAARAARRAGP